MAKKNNIPVDVLKQLLRLENGRLFWLTRPVSFFKTQIDCIRWNNKQSGKAAFTAKRYDGYFVGRICGHSARAHRVIWALHYGEWPSDEIDHINGNPSDNRIENLRVVSSVENSRNQKIRRDNKSGFIGVYWMEKRKTWHSYIKANGKKNFLGRFNTLEDAAKARKAAEKKYGFHPNNGTR